MSHPLGTWRMDECAHLDAGLHLGLGFGIGEIERSP